MMYFLISHWFPHLDVSNILFTLKSIGVHISETTAQLIRELYWTFLIYLLVEWELKNSYSFTRETLLVIKIWWRRCSHCFSECSWADAVWFEFYDSKLMWHDVQTFDYHKSPAFEIRFKVTILTIPVLVDFTTHVKLVVTLIALVSSSTSDRLCSLPSGVLFCHPSDEVLKGGVKTLKTQLISLF